MKNTEPVSSTKKNKVVKSAVRTVQLFSVFAEKKQPLSLAEISERMKAPKSSCFELIHTLMHLGYIIGIDGGKSYYPSRRLYETAEHINQFNPIKEKVQNALVGLRDTTGETIFIGRLQGNQVAYTEVFDGTHAMRFTANSGDLKAIHASALGKALLGCLDEAAQNQLISELKLNRYSEHTITRKRDLKENLVQCEKQGIYTTIGEHFADVMAVAVPVKIQGNQLAVGIAGPIPRMQKNLKTYSQALKGVAAAIAS